MLNNEPFKILYPLPNIPPDKEIIIGANYYKINSRNQLVDSNGKVAVIERDNGLKIYKIFNTLSDFRLIKMLLTQTKLSKNELLELSQLYKIRLYDDKVLEPQYLELFKTTIYWVDPYTVIYRPDDYNENSYLERVHLYANYELSSYKAIKENEENKECDVKLGYYYDAPEELFRNVIVITYPCDSIYLQHQIDYLNELNVIKVSQLLMSFNIESLPEKVLECPITMVLKFKHTQHVVASNKILVLSKIILTDIASETSTLEKDDKNRFMYIIDIHNESTINLLLEYIKTGTVLYTIIKDNISILDELFTIAQHLQINNLLELIELIKKIKD